MPLPGKGFLIATAVLLAGCEERIATPAEPELIQMFECTQLLIGTDTGYCHEDIVGPGLLSIRFLPDPRETSWELSVRGLAALAEQCEFSGQFDQTRLSALQGRGETEIVCAIDATVDRQYHELRFQNRLEAANTAITVRVQFER